MKCHNTYELAVLPVIRSSSMKDWMLLYVGFVPESKHMVQGNNNQSDDMAMNRQVLHIRYLSY